MQNLRYTKQQNIKKTRPKNLSSWEGVRCREITEKLDLSRDGGKEGGWGGKRERKMREIKRKNERDKEKETKIKTERKIS